MSKTRMLNKTVTTTIILLLTLSILNVINFVAIPRASAVTLVNITQPTVGIAVNETGYWKAGGSYTTSGTPIQVAISLATDTNLNVTVAAGTYTEDLVINTANITLRSEIGKDNTTIQLVDGVGIDVQGGAVNFTLGGAADHGFTILGGATTFDIQLTNSVFGVKISYNRVNTTGTASMGISEGSGGVANLTISNNEFITQLNDGAIWGVDVTNSTVSSNTFTGPGGFVGGYAAQFSGVTNSTISGNTINGYGYGVLVYGGGVTGLDVSNVTISDNTISSCTRGIQIGAASTKLVENVTVTRNTLSSNTRAIYIDVDAEVHPATFTILYNNINVNNTTYGLQNAHATQVNATLNWWGHTTGPWGDGYGYGANVSTAVLYDPWLSAAYPSTTVFAGIWLKPTRASAGSTIEVFSSMLDFSSAETVRTYFEASTVNTTTAATNGSLYANFTVPSLSAGAYTVTSVGGTSSNSYSATFTIPTLSITLTPTWGPPGKTVSVTGEGFTRLGLVRIYLGATYMNSTSADAYGNITNTFTVPTTTVPGTYTVKANDASTTSNATQTLTVPTHALTTITPTAGPPGIEVAVTGGNFTVSGIVGIYFDTTLAGNLTANTDGAITTGHVHVPSLVPGAYAVKGKDWNTGIYTASTSFTVSTPLIARAPTWGPPGTTVTVSGGNFTIDNGTKIYFDTTSVANTTTNSTGGIDTSNTFNVPSVVPGTYTVRVMDNYTAYNVTTTFTVPTPTLTLIPDGGPPSTTVTVSGDNFTKTGAVRIYLDAISMNNVTTGADGSIPALTTFTVPANTTIGAHTVRAFDVATTYNKTATFTAGPVIWIDTATGTPLTNVTVTGSGFAINQTAKIYFDTTFIQDAAVNASGGLNTWFLIPDAVTGAHNITAYDVNSTIWTPAKTFTVSQPTITLNLAEGQVGQLVLVTGGTLFKPNATVNIYFGSTLVRTVNATTGGALLATNFTVPSVLPAQYTVNASDGVNYATATFNVVGTGGIDTLQSMVAEIEAKLDQYGSFWNFTNTWFTTISNKLGVFTGTDTVASLLYTINTTVSTINWASIAAIKAKTDTINWADITSIKSTTTLSIDYLWGLQDHPLWGLRTKIVPMLESIKNATQFTAGTYNTIMPNSTAPVNLGKSSKITLTVRATDDATEGFVIKAYIYDGTAWRPLSFSVSGAASADCAATVEFTTGTDGRLYFETTGATFTAFIYSAEFSP